MIGHGLLRFPCSPRFKNVQTGRGERLEDIQAEDGSIFAGLVAL
jgi:hypothetical protein